MEGVLLSTGAIAVLVGVVALVEAVGGKRRPMPIVVVGWLGQYFRTGRAALREKEKP